MIKESLCTYIFLDVDGVLNRKEDWRTMFSLNKECVNTFCKLLDQLNSYRIVLSSTWRNGSQMDKLKAYFPIYGVTPTTTNKTRQEEIEYYIKKNNVKKYVIIDDDESLFTDKSRINLYLVNYMTGITDSDIKKIKKMLK